MVCVGSVLSLFDLEGESEVHWMEEGELAVLVAPAGETPSWSRQEFVRMLSPRLGLVWVPKNSMERSMRRTEAR